MRFACYAVVLAAAILAVGPVSAQEQSSSNGYTLPKTVEIVNVEVNGQPVTFYHTDELNQNKNVQFTKVAEVKPGSEFTVTLTLKAKESGKVDVVVAPPAVMIPPEYSIMPEGDYRKTLDVTAGQQYKVEFKFKVGTEPNPFALGPYYFMMAQVLKHVENQKELTRSDILDTVVWKIEFGTSQGQSSSTQPNMQQELEKLKQMIEQQIQQKMEKIGRVVIDMYRYGQELYNYVMSLPMPSALDVIVGGLVGPMFARTVSGLLTGALATAVATLAGVPFPMNLAVGALVGAVLNVPAAMVGLMPAPPKIPTDVQQLIQQIEQMTGQG